MQGYSSGQRGLTVNQLASPSGVQIPLPAPQFRALCTLKLQCYNNGMKCPNCDKEMRKVRWAVTSNSKTDKELIEYDFTTYQCTDDDIWVNTEIPLNKNVKQELHQ